MSPPSGYQHMTPVGLQDEFHAAHFTTEGWSHKHTYTQSGKTSLWIPLYGAFSLKCSIASSPLVAGIRFSWPLFLLLTFLAESERSQKLADMDAAQQLKFRDRQRFFEEVFQHDVDVYLSSAHLCIRDYKRRELVVACFCRHMHGHA